MKKINILLLSVALTLPILGFLWLQGYWQINTPMQDDFDAILQPATQWKSKEHSIRRFVDLIWTQDDERRIVVVRLTALALTQVLGYLDFSAMKWIGVSLNFILLGLIFHLIRQRKLSLWFLFPVVLIVFSQANFHALHWAMIPVQHIGVFIWGFTCLWALSRGYGWIGLLLGLWTLGSDVSGILIWPAGMLVGLIRRDWKLLAVWTTLMGLAVGGYMWNLEMPTYRPSLADTFQAWPDLLGLLWIFPALFADIFPDISTTTRLIWLSIVALGMWYVLVPIYFEQIKAWFQSKSFSSDESWILGSLSFLIATALVFIFGRASEGITVILDSRYRHIYHFLVVFLWLWYLVAGKASRWLAPVSVTLVMWHLGILHMTWGYIDHFRQIQLTDMYAWQHQRGMPNTGIYYAMQKEVDRVIEEGEKWNVYRPAEFPFAPLAHAPVAGKAHARWVNVTSTSRGVEVVDQPRGFGKDQGNYLVLQSEQTSYILPIRYPRRLGWKSLIPSRYYDTVGHSILIQHHMFQPGRYQVYLGKPSAQGWALLDTQLTYEPTLPTGG